jgi:transposase InsO family protein
MARKSSRRSKRAGGHRQKPSLHLDHTKLDTTVVEQGGDRPLRKPWLLTVVDTHSRAILGSVVVKESPNYKAVVERLFSTLTLPPGNVTARDGQSNGPDLPEVEE